MLATMAEHQVQISQQDSSDDPEITTHKAKYIARRNMCLILRTFLNYMLRHPNTIAASELEIQDMAEKEAKLTHDIARIDRLLERRRQSICPQAHVSMQPMQTGQADVQPTQTGRQGVSKAAYDGSRFRRIISVEGEDIPPQISSFHDLCIPDFCLPDLWVKTGIARPTPIQVQGLPVIFSGRDMIGVAPTGSGKTLTLALPLVCFSLQEERRVPLLAGVGPVGLVLCPSEEHARQTLDLIKKLDFGHPPLRFMLCIGDMSNWRLLRQVWEHGVHIVVATPSRLNNLLERRKMTLESCTYIALDWVDRLLELGFEDDIRKILGCYSAQRPGAPRQTVMFSATMPERVQKFAQSVLVRPVVVKVGTTAAANLNVVQVVEHVNQAAKLVSLFKLCLRKTPVPVLIFCETTANVDVVHKYLLWKGVAAVAIHGGQDPAERESAISSFKTGDKIVLIATDYASNGVDFPDIQHVINFDMPAEIETYFQRIAWTGRGGKTGLATSFINRIQPSTEILFDLKHLLKEAKQKIPPMLAALDDPMEVEVEDRFSSTDGV